MIPQLSGKGVRSGGFTLATRCVVSSWEGTRFDAQQGAVFRFACYNPLGKAPGLEPRSPQFPDIGIQTMKNMQLVQRIRGEHHLVNHLGQIWVPSQEEEKDLDAPDDEEDQLHDEEDRPPSPPV
ncbi:hypothetical protein L1987_18316 [Smallanthus sonchifolius]|uniref:Uncharacterized protein n=1 Tax=Smallanthus sonchifolius TaxID=185202 RepID=A0ACB9J086_9ASTR|nr:hypothetical protein L1987_18316 [Smallanthus sonchifolius]